LLDHCPRTAKLPPSRPIPSPISVLFIFPHLDRWAKWTDGVGTLGNGGMGRGGERRGQMAVRRSSDGKWDGTEWAEGAKRSTPAAGPEQQWMDGGGEHPSHNGASSSSSTHFPHPSIVLLLPCLGCVPSPFITTAMTTSSFPPLRQP
jgi:hypothetical protein